VSECIDCDVLIVGGGLVGSVLALTLQAADIRTVLVEARDPAQLGQDSFDGRATALANGSRRILEQLGLWQSLSSDAAAIRSIHIGEQGRFGAARIEAHEEGVDALGYTVENRVLGQRFWERLAQCKDFTCLAPARLQSFDTQGDSVRAKVALDGTSVAVRAQLIVAADGARSSVRESLGIEAREDDYAQQALILNCTTEQALNGRAFERFTATGPLAVLPLSAGRAAVIWTLDNEEAETVAALGDAEFHTRLQAAFGYRLGRFQRVGRRDCHPLRRIRSASVSAHRSILIGSAAVNLHPVAGQGFNLALRDVATLAEVISDVRAPLGQDADIGADSVLARYREWRAHDQRSVARFTHGLVHGFGLQMPGAGTARGLALLAFDLLPGGKAWLARQTMGITGRLPRLARGLPLNSR
jgi:2-octaprenyl-6-methoxyphenol hydroxylase